MPTWVMAAVARLRGDERGQGLVEYALIVSVVALGSIAALVFLRDEIASLFSKAGNSIAAGAGDGTFLPPSPVAPSGGIVTLTCSSTPCDDDSQGPGDPEDILTASTSGWAGSPTSFTFQWQRRGEDPGAGDLCVDPLQSYSPYGAAVVVVASGGMGSTTIDPPPALDSCYRVVVTATAGALTATPVTSSPVHVNND